jgi:hypothetical protein
MPSHESHRRKRAGKPHGFRTDSETEKEDDDEEEESILTVNTFDD